MQIPDFSYKQHIDGIRALAVVSVILFHLNPAFFPGGYLGVDVFFVISGFVITQSLYKNYCVKGRIEIYEFYVKRFKRLYPALVFMVFTTTFAYVFFGFLWDTNLFLKSVVTSIFATSNLYFLYHGENYFHQDLVNPLLHTWSLGVEEQFYVVYPLLLALGLWLVTKFKLKPIILGLIFLISSILLYVLFSSSGDIIFNSFYSPLTRFWELGAGCALFFLSQYFSFDKFNQTTTVISFLCILGITFFQSDINNFKTETLAIVLATSVLIFAGINSKSLISRFLSHKFTTHIGRISYSLYLWHFPVIYFAYLYLDKTWAYILAIIVMVVLAEFSYSYIEKPLRYSESFELMLRKAVKVSPYLLATAVLSVSVIGQGNVRTGINQTFNSTGEKIKPINYIESNFNLGERIQPRYTLNGVDASSCADVSKSKYLTKNEQGLFDTCMKQSDDKTLFFLTGDSHSFHFLSAFDNSSVIENLYFVEIPRQSIINEISEPFDEEMSDTVLRKQKEQLSYLAQEFEDIYYVTSFFLSPRQDQIEVMKLRLEKYIETLKDDATLIFIAPTPVFPTGPESCVLLERHCTIDKVADLERRESVLNMLLEFEEKYEEVFVYDAYDEICPEDKCIIYNHESDFLSYIDKDHLSVEQSVKLGTHLDQWLHEKFSLSTLAMNGSHRD